MESTLAIRKVTERIEVQVQPETPLPLEPSDDTVTLELELYANYNLGGYNYLKGKPYRFSRLDAMSLLAERDHGRPIWKIYRPVKVVKKQIEVEDVTDRRLPEEADSFPVALPNKTQTRIDVGDAAEIQELLDEDSVVV
jgi:hypothetical protein